MGNLGYNISTVSYGSSKDGAIDSLFAALKADGYSPQKQEHSDTIAINMYGLYNVVVLKDGSEDEVWQVGVSYRS